MQDRTLTVQLQNHSMMAVACEPSVRNELKEYLAENGVGTLIQWGGKAVHEFRDLGFTQSLPFTEKVMRSSLMLPLNMTVTNDEIRYICDCIGNFYND